MRTIRLPAQVTKDHMVHLRLPEDVHEGPAEVIIVVPDRANRAPSRPAKRETLSAFLSGPRLDQSLLRSKKDIDEALTSERDGWGPP